MKPLQVESMSSSPTITENVSNIRMDQCTHSDATGQAKRVSQRAFSDVFASELGETGAAPSIHKTLKGDMIVPQNPGKVDIECPSMKR